jgi:hypothetical protein
MKDTEYIISQLQNNKFTFKSLLSDLGQDEYKWKYLSEKWCLLEVVCHLVDEEKEDFRQRVKTTLESPGESPPPIDPVKWVQQRNYIDQNFQEKLEEFLMERDKSIDWLMSLKEPNWENSYVHQELGPFTAFQFLSNWLAHDYLHIRQIVKIKFEHLKKISTEENDYAGNW